MKFSDFLKSFREFLDSSPALELDDSGPCVFLSDLHMGDGGESDDLRHNREPGYFCPRAVVPRPGLHPHPRGRRRGPPEIHASLDPPGLARPVRNLRRLRREGQAAQARRQPRPRPRSGERAALRTQPRPRAGTQGPHPLLLPRPPGLAALRRAHVHQRLRRALPGQAPQDQEPERLRATRARSSRRSGGSTAPRSSSAWSRSAATPTGPSSSP